MPVPRSHLLAFYSTVSARTDFISSISLSKSGGLIEFQPVCLWQNIAHHSIYQNIMVKEMGGHIAYYRKHYVERDVIGVHFEETNNKVAIIMGSGGQIIYWKYKKNGLHVDFMDGLLKKLVENNLFDKTEGWLKGYDWYSVDLAKSNTTDNDIDTFLSMNNEQYKRSFKPNSHNAPQFFS